MNAAQQTSSKMCGVSWSKQKRRWRARIQLNGKEVSLGYFTSQKQAALAYDAFVRVPAAPNSRARPHDLTTFPRAQLREHNLHRGPNARPLNFPNPEASANLSLAHAFTARRVTSCVRYRSRAGR